MNLSCKRILIVEDDLSISELLEEVLRENGYTCRILPYVEDILSVVNEFRPEVILLDYLLPVANGEELCARIKQNKSTCAIPVVIYSAFPRLLLPVEEFKCDSFISKPFDLFTLLNQIEKLVLRYRRKSRKTRVFHF